jgi:hypothetical protein
LAIQIDFDRALHDMEYHDSTTRVTFGPYSPTYLIATDEAANQDIKRYMYNGKDKKYCEKVLTVSASGDHPLFCKMYGAKQITTFDITYASKIIMDIKTLAIKMLTFDNYWQLLKDLWNNPNITSVSNFESIMQKLDSNEQKYIHTMDRKFALFNFGTPPGYYHVSDTNNQKSLYEGLHLSDLPTFPFIWTDIKHLDAKLGDNTYDFIHLSNILDFVNDDIKVSVLKQLTQRLNYGGRILMRRINGNYQLADICQNIEKQSDDLGFVNRWDQMILLKCR